MESRIKRLRAVAAYSGFVDLGGCGAKILVEEAVGWSGGGSTSDRTSVCRRRWN